MYGKTPTVGGLALLPATGTSRPLFIAAVSLIVGGVAIMIVATVMARKSRRSEAN
jgi:predicted phage tail protein